MEKILLLGAFGFIGTNLMKHVDKAGLPYRFITLDRFDRHQAGLSFGCIDRSYAGDFSDEALIGQVFDENDIDIVVHCVSSTIPTGNQSARYDFESNLIPTVNLLDIMVARHCSRIVFISSGGAVYGDSGKCHSEAEAVFPISAYGVVKVAIEKTLFQYAASKGLQPLVVRLSNPYGRYHYSARQGIVNVALRAAQSNSPFIVWGDGSAKKDYIFVEDFCQYLFQLMEKGIWNELINVGSGHLYTVNQILEEIRRHYPSFSWTYDTAKKSDVPQLSLDLSKMHSFGDHICLSLEEVLPTLL